MYNILYLRGIYEGTLYTRRLISLREQHIAASYKLLSSIAVEDSLGVYARRYLEGYPCGEVGFDNTCYNIYRRSLSRNNHMYADGSGKLCNTRYRHLYVFACRHYKVAKLIDYHYDVR